MEDIFFFFRNESFFKLCDSIIDDEIRDKFKLYYYNMFDISFAEGSTHFANIFIILDDCSKDIVHYMQVLKNLIPSAFVNIVLFSSSLNINLLNSFYQQKLDALLAISENRDILKLGLKKILFSFYDKYNFLKYADELEKITDSFIHIGEYQGKELHDAFYESILMLAKSAEAKDEITGNHVQRVQYYVKSLALEYGIEPYMAEHYGLCSILHDIGKLKIPDYILKKPGKLTLEEYEFIQKHTIFGYEILSKDPFYDVARDIALYHHEKWNGKGYPKGLKGEEIPLAAQFTAIADVFDALTNARSYKKAWSFEDTLDFIKSQSNKSFSSELVDLFFSLVEKNIIQDIMTKYID